MSFIAGAASANVDLLYRNMPRLPEPGEEIYTDEFSLQLGGGLPATLINLGRLGVPAKIATELGDDLFSRFAAEEFEKNGVSPLNLYHGEKIPVNITSAVILPDDRSFISYGKGDLEADDGAKEAFYEMARGAKAAGSLVFIGMGDPAATARVAESGAEVIKIVKPYADEDLIFERLDMAKKSGCLGVGMDIDHTFSRFGEYDNVMGFSMNAKTEADLRRYIARTGLPFVIKGVLSVRDALKCAELGAQGIVVSHHHGIMKYAVPPLYILPEIRKAVGKSLTIFLDCDVENGFDVFKALALGADAVSVGRAIMPPLRDNAAQGVCDRILQINGELRAAMNRTGAKTIAEIDPSTLHFFVSA